MRYLTAVACVAGFLSLCHVEAQDLSVSTGSLEAQFTDGKLCSLVDGVGATMVRAGTQPAGLAIRRISGQDYRVASGTGEAAGNDVRYGVEGLPDAEIRHTLVADTAMNDLVVTQGCSSPQPGVWGVSWSVGDIPLDMNIIVPGRSGIKLDASVPGSRHSFDYPLGWEAQLVIIEGQGRGFYIWAEDAVGVFKQLDVERGQNGWQLIFTTVNAAPFDDLTACESVTWRLNTYEGDWRVPARRYRDWMESNLGPTAVSDQQPAWVKDIRACVIMGMDIPLIESLAERLDPTQTILYIPNWRTAGYDRDYPVYDEVFDELDPFLTRAHELGYRVMLHVNYFGCDPLNPLYEQFEPYQCRDAFGDHSLLWWLWERADPIIKFAYINPAHKPWRDLFVERMVKLCGEHDVDSLHLDQTLCIFNDNNGLMDGQNMIQGNVALHRELREAIPNVALSGEGLDEVTYRYEAFAQRHVWGVDHTEGTSSATWLRTAHPISSYLLRPYTTIYGYLGCAPPTDGQLYSAWNDAYEHWGVIPTLKPDAGQVAEPRGFSRQFFDEAALWQDERVDIDPEADWPEDVCFPFRAQGGARVLRMADGRLTFGDTEVSRTAIGSREIVGEGTVLGVPLYDATRTFGLDPNTYYACVTDPRDMDALHIEQVPSEFTVESILTAPGLAVIRTRQSGGIVADLTADLGSATGGSGPFDGEITATKGAFESLDGAVFTAGGDGLDAHPPWKLGEPGYAFITYDVDLPDEGEVRLVSDVVLRRGAMGEDRSDGVTFRATVRGPDGEVVAEVHHASESPAELELDLTPMAGERVEVELLVHAGPAGNPSFDWAHWSAPRIEQRLSTRGELSVVSPGAYTVALSGATSQALVPEGRTYRVSSDMPGAVCLLSDQPEEVALPLDLRAADLLVATTAASGGILLEAQPGTAAIGPGVVGGVERAGIHAHPPDRGSMVLALPMVLPDDPAEVHSFIGLRDASLSEGVIFSIQINGQTVAEETLLPGVWREISADLAPWAGQPVVLTLVTDSDGSYYYDWAVWGEPLIRLATR